MSQNRKDLQTQVATIKQTPEKVLDKDASLAERICILFKEKGITIFSILTAFSMTIATIILAITDGGVRSRGTGGTQSKDNGTLKKWLDRPADALKRLAGKADKALTAIVGSIVAAILSFLEKAVGFVAAGLVGWWLMQKVRPN